jgi:hypothetical protein
MRLRTIEGGEKKEKRGIRKKAQSLPVESSDSSLCAELGWDTLACWNVLALDESNVGPIAAGPLQYLF